MTTVWNRLKYTLESDLDGFIAKKEEKNPIALLNRYIKEAEQQTEQTGEWLKRQAKLNETLEKELTEAASVLEKRRHQQQLAEGAGEEELAAFASREVEAYSSRVHDLETGIAENRREYELLERKYEEMKHKVKDMKIRQLRLMGKENSVRANVYMDRVLNPEQAEDEFGTPEEMTAYIEHLGNRTQERFEQNVLVSRLEALEKNSARQSEIG